MSTHPEILWAQRSSESDEQKNIVYLTVNLPDIQENTLKYDLTPTTISFSATSGNASKGLEERNYAFNFNLYEEVIPESSLRKLTSRSFAVILRKKEKQLEFWPRLTKEKVKTPFIKTDFSKWVDEDEQEGVAAEPEDDFDGPDAMGPSMGGMGGMGGMPPGMGGMDLEAMMKQFGGGAGGPGGAGGAPPDDADEDDSDDDGPPPLEDAEPVK